MSYTGTVEYLYGLQQYGMKFGLDNIQRLMTSLGNPHKAFRSIHVAGTNGKGSTSAMIESILRNSGIRTGIFTSPHLVSFTERIRINGEEILESDVIELADEVRSIAETIEEFSPTFFEVVTAMAFLHFRKMEIEWAVVEVGMGGRLDATNILSPEVSVITNIGLDHGEFLGLTLKEIAREKAGIIKKNIPVVTADQRPEVIEIISSKADESDSVLDKENTAFSSEIVREEDDGVIFNYNGNTLYREIKLPLMGDHQIANASVAARTIEVISNEYPEIDFDIRKGLENVRWPGRLEIIKYYPPVLIDGAHNPDAASGLSKYIKKVLGLKYKRIILIVGIMKDKDIEGILKPILPLASEIIFTAPAYGRASTPDELESFAASMGYGSKKALTVTDALNLAETLYMPDDIILVTGSFYTIGEAREALVQKGVLTSLRE